MGDAFTELRVRDMALKPVKLIEQILALKSLSGLTQWKLQSPVSWMEAVDPEQQLANGATMRSARPVSRSYFAWTSLKATAVPSNDARGVAQHIN
jgi:hypothetical protein